MPTPLRKFGLVLHRQMRADDIAFAKELRQGYKVLEFAMGGITQQIVTDIFDDLRLNPDVWKSKQRTYLGYYQTTINGFYDQWAKKTEALQKRAFFNSFFEFRKLLNQLYPKRYRTFKNAEAFTAFYGDKVARETFKDVREDDLKINLVLRSDANESFKQFLQDQIDLERPPGSLIKTISPEHTRIVQREVLLGMDQGLSHAQTRDKIVAQISTAVAGSEIRKKMEYNVMRIARSSYQQAAAAEMAYFSAQNAAMVSGIMRVADGRPCLACAMLDGKIYPVGTQIPDHPNGMCVGVPVLKTPSEMGLSIPQDLEDKIWKGQQRKFKTLGDRFEKLTKGEKQKVFGNDALFNWWWRNKQRVKASDLVVLKNGMVSPMSLKQAIAKFGDGVSKKTAISQSLVSKVNSTTIPPVEPKGEFAFGYDKKLDGDLKALMVDFEKTRNLNLADDMYMLADSIVQTAVGRSSRLQFLDTATTKKIKFRVLPDAEMKALTGMDGTQVYAVFSQGEIIMPLSVWEAESASLIMHTLIHETIHAYGCAGPVVFVREGTTELIARMISKKYGLALSSAMEDGYVAYMQGIARISYLAGGGTLEGTAKVLHDVFFPSVRYSKVSFEKRWKILERMSNKIYSKNPKLFKKLFRDKDGFYDWFSSFDKLKDGSVKQWAAKLKKITKSLEELGYSDLDVLINMLGSSL